MATTYSNVLEISAGSRRIASVPRSTTTQQPSPDDTRACPDVGAAALGTAPAVLNPYPGHLTWAARWLAEAFVLGFAAYGAAHTGLPLDRFHDVEPPL